MTTTHWNDLSPTPRRSLRFLISLPFSLLATALIDMLRRSPDQINSGRWAWGPLLSFVLPEEGRA
jgi:hypothetical protein